MEYTLLDALNVRVIGSGIGPYLVFGHGIGTDQSVWNRILPNFTPYYRVVIYDLACAGSVSPDFFQFSRYTIIDGFVDDLIYILDSLEIPTCFFVGHSISGMIALLAAIRRPELFSGLILIGASPRFLKDVDYAGGSDERDVEAVFEAMEYNYRAWAAGFAPLAVGADVPEAVREFSRTLFNMRPDISLFVSRMVFNTDLRGVLGLVRVPCYIIQTANDTAVPSFVAEYMRDQISGPTLIIPLNTEGHIPQLSSPTLLAQGIRRALAHAAAAAAASGSAP